MVRDSRKHGAQIRARRLPWVSSTETLRHHERSERMSPPPPPPRGRCCIPPEFHSLSAEKSSSSACWKCSNLVILPSRPRTCLGPVAFPSALASPADGATLSPESEATVRCRRLSSQSEAAAGEAKSSHGEWGSSAECAAAVPANLREMWTAGGGSARLRLLDDETGMGMMRPQGRPG